MLFSNFEFFLFFAFVFFFYWYILPLIYRNPTSLLKGTHLFLLIVSYFFYMSWDWRFGGLILISTWIDFYAGSVIFNSSRLIQRKIALWVSVIVNLVFILGFFKYYNFLAESLNIMMQSYLGFPTSLPILDIILPVGVSFYTFQSLSYTIDIYRGVIPAERSFVKFALFVSFFPQLVAGPIVMAKTFLPQLEVEKSVNDIPFRKAIRYFLMGYFKKVILSDNVSPIVDLIYANPEAYSTGAIWLATILFAVQIYCDFSGYSDMAYSVALLLGFHLPENFRMPFISLSITEYWRRWHLTLSSWLRDYVYISMGGSKAGVIRHRFNLWFTMFVGGVWHGANWTFVIWGSIQGGLLLVEIFLKNFRERFIHFDYSAYRPYMNVFRLFFTMFITLTTASCFRAESLEKEIIILGKMFQYSEGILRPYMLKTGIPAIAAMIIGHWLGYLIFEKGKIFKIPPKLEFALYPIGVILFSLFTPDNEIPFIYFQF
ncbi:MBOAT family O-acyltransferase [Leptospira sp. GIMC2001]|uniref:MBOAT family O-acyltransferase n=1 Tax=Leptospira sp. GIMC2001 TaxID=1513297 RepID=UPI00234A7E88|nr:MBOAT family O-acyltransferase [Leptospira sp. GIMC2001]WCL48826.1 MBOAT family protein [Leptospira sp. GIMC2001]